MHSDLKIIHVTDKNKNMLSIFIDNMGSSSETFRYFKTRSVEDAIKSHERTVVLLRGDDIIGYGHLDRDEKLWLGICLIESESGKGYGKSIMNKLLEDQKETIYLTVDKTNFSAIKMYENYGFVQIQDKKTFIVMEKHE